MEFTKHKATESTERRKQGFILFYTVYNLCFDRLVEVNILEVNTSSLPFSRVINETCAIRFPY